MSDLTRDEIRAACKAVPGWEWDERAGHAWEDGIDMFMYPEDRHEGYQDNLALLQAWCNEHPDREVQLFINRDKPGLILIPEEGFDCAIAMDGPLRTAAVRAVNQWAEAKSKEAP